MASKLGILLWLALAAVSVQAQVGGMDAEFAGGGARALAMGGAFIGLADDATATEFNPAGLWQLRTPEVAAQIIRTYNSHREGMVERSGHGLAVDFHDEEDDYFVPSFASAVYPMQHLVIGLSEFTNVYFKRSRTDPLDEILPKSSLGRMHEKGSNYTYGVTVAKGLTDDLWLGGTVRDNFFRYSLETEMPGTGDTFAADTPSANVGVIWRPLPKFRLGSVYKSTQRLEGSFRGTDIDTHLPDTWGGGVAFLPGKRCRLDADVDRIWWSKFDPNRKDAFAKEDVWRYHVGGEWYAGRILKTGVFLRGGYCYEESNAFHYQGTNPLTRALANVDPIQHYTVGLGLARPGYQLDFGADFGDDGKTDVITSMVVYF